MRVGICDDSQVERNEILNIWLEQKWRRNLPWDVVLFEDGDQIFRYEKDLDLLILDIEMPKVGGIQVKEHFEQRDRQTLIIFVTGHSEVMVEAFGKQVVAFVDKAYLNEMLPKALEKAILYAEKVVFIEGRIDSRRILYIQAEQVYSHIYMENSKEEVVCIGLKELEQQLQSVGFLRIHRSYLVNMEKINEMYRDKVFIQGKKLPVSIRLQTRVHRIYGEYCRKKSRYPIG